MRARWGIAASVATLGFSLAACGGGTSVDLPTGVTRTFLGRVQWAHTRCPHIAVTGFSCALAYQVVLAYYAHPSKDFQVTTPTDERPLEIVCTSTLQAITCAPLVSTTDYLTFTGPPPDS